MNDSDDIGTDNQKWKQIGQDIDRYSWEYGDKFWSSVSLSGDGKTLVVGAYGDYDVGVYRINDSKSDWMQLGENFGGDYYPNSAYSVSLSEDGNTVAIGSAHYNVDLYTDNAGRVRLFVVE
jgi:WD40 repeat protein